MSYIGSMMLPMSIAIDVGKIRCGGWHWRVSKFGVFCYLCVNPTPEDA
jgi:hypothetical protein